MKNILFTTILFLSFCRLEIPKDKIPELGLLSALIKVKSVATGTGTGTNTGTTTGTGTSTGTGTGSASSSSPTFSPVAGQYNTPQSITISTTTTGATVYYTTDGTDPTSASNQYTSPIHIWSIAGKTIKAISIKSGLTNSTIATATYSYPPLKTGQTSCYDGSNNAVACSSTYKGQDGQENQGVARSYTGPTAHATYTSDYTTTDNATGLVWKTCSQGLSGSTCLTGTAATLTWDNASADATNGCNALNSANGGNGYAGKKNWRLPTIIELSILIDAGLASGATINATPFPTTIPGNYWSYTTYALDITYAWCIDFNVGPLGTCLKTVNTYLRCVAGQSKDSLFTFKDNGDGTIKDNTTALIWQKCSGGLINDSTCSGTANSYTWTNANSYCNSLTLAGKVWRLPNRNELQSLVDYTKTSGATIDATSFPATINYYYWSSTTFSPITTNAWFVAFDSGGVNIYLKTQNYYVRCVSGP